MADKKPKEIDEFGYYPGIKCAKFRFVKNGCLYDAETTYKGILTIEFPYKNYWIRIRVAPPGSWSGDCSSNKSVIFMSMGGYYWVRFEVFDSRHNLSSPLRTTGHPLLHAQEMNKRLNRSNLSALIESTLILVNDWEKRCMIEKIHRT